jgi:shikimate dehydrogenase
MEFGLIGKNISYSLSPLIHNANFKACLIDADYHIIDLNDLHSKIHDLKKLNGFNITTPYKEVILPYCDFISDEVKEIGACNTVKVIDGKFHGYNTDVYGFYQLLKVNQLLNRGKETKVLIIGAGGAAKAVHYTFKKFTNYQVFITNRTLQKAQKISENTIDFKGISLKLKEFDIVIQATNLGVKNYESPIEIDAVKVNSVYIDLNYQTNLKFLDDSKMRGAKTINGLEMLIQQAAKSYEIWVEDRANLEVIKKVILEKVGKSC